MHWKGTSTEFFNRVRNESSRPSGRQTFVFREQELLESVEDNQVVVICFRVSLDVQKLMGWPRSQSIQRPSTKRGQAWRLALYLASHLPYHQIGVSADDQASPVQAGE
ncbi:hypothetical protein L914_21465 [Phytophthora nicotianae]|uniref:Uncharacterized protein n=1 Tax=Phytophthora nicotianae TaxID=4792 RepID=W2M3J8_PHYNI|nr:hypothetical protein L914_21465 [Phytophthora nicotianae]